MKVHYSFPVSASQEFIDSIPFLSFQQRRMLREQADDLALWGLEGRFSDIRAGDR